MRSLPISSGKNGCKAHILSIHGIRRFKSGRHDSPQRPPEREAFLVRCGAKPLQSPAAAQLPPGAWGKFSPTRLRRSPFYLRHQVRYGLVASLRRKIWCDVGRRTYWSIAGTSTYENPRYSPVPCNSLDQYPHWLALLRLKRKHPLAKRE